MLCLFTAVTSLAQKIQVVDSRNHPVSFANVRTDDGYSIGFTDINGFLPPAPAGVESVYISHLAFNPQKVSLRQAVEGKIHLQESVVTLKTVDIRQSHVDYICTRFFYRVCLTVDGKIRFYDMGIADNYLKPKEHTSTEELLTHVQYLSRPYQILRRGIPPDIGNISVVEKMKSNPDFVFSETSKQQDIKFHNQLVARFVQDSTARTTRIDVDRSKLYSLNENSAEARRDSTMQVTRDTKSTYLYRINSQNYTSMKDFISGTERWVEIRKAQDDKAKDIHIDFLLEGFAVEQTYLTTREMKKRKKKKFPKMSFTQLEQFRKDLRIPDLDAKLNGLLKEQRPVERK